MADDRYISYPAIPAPTTAAYERGGSQRSRNSDGNSDNSATPLGRTSVQREGSWHSSVAAGSEGHLIPSGIPAPATTGDSKSVPPGQPIGLLAAIGTQYAKKPIWRSKKCKILCPILGGITAIVTIVITLIPVLRAIAVHTISTSVMHIAASNITSPTNTTFGLTLEGQVKKVGIFPAHLLFPKPVSVFWIAPENLTNELLLGSFNIAEIGIAAGHGRIKQQTFFNITNEPAFARFTEYLITQSEFTWRLKTTGVQAKAFSFIPVNGLTFIKDLTLPGMANMTDISIADFQLPGDDPAGGISLAVSTKFTNPSAFGVEMGTLAVDLYYQDLYLGPAQSSTPINLTSGVNTVNLVGRMLDYSDNPKALAQLSVVFSNYLNGLITPVKAVGRSVTPVNGIPIDWLSKGIKALTLSVPLQSPTGRISPITSITIKELSLGFDAVQPYAPTANSSNIDATFGLPFGFSLNIAKLQTSFTIVDNKTAITSLAGPFGLAKTAILTRNAGYTTGALSLDLPMARLVTPPSYTDHLIFDQFNYDFTTTNGANFILVGNTSVVTDTPIGQVLLTDIGFTVPAGLIGLSGLTTAPTEILSVDVMGGNPDAVILAIKVGLTNPSNLDLEVGDVTFQLFNGDSFLGTTVLPNLHLTTGYQEHDSIGYFQANANPVALSTFTGYAQGNNAQLKISGFNGSTKCESLAQAFMAIHLNTTLTGLTTKLLNYANLTVLPSTGVTNNFANSIVSLANPFTSVLDITNIQSNITSHGFFVGSIVQDVVFNAAGKAASISPVLNFNLNLFPPDIFALLRALAVSAGLNPAPLDGVVAIGGYAYSKPATNVVKRSLELDTDSSDFSDPDLEQSVLAKRANIYTGFDLPAFVLTAFAGLEVNIDLVSALQIGEFKTNLAYSQQAVPAHTDSSLTLLLPVLARPIVQKIVDGSILGISTIMITNPSNTAFDTALVGSITNAGPFDAVIGFPSGLTVAWNGAPLGQIAMPNVPLVADVGASLNINAAFAVANLAHLTDFTGYLLTEPSFVWQIYGTNLSVAALGITVDGISISKNVILDGMDGFKNLVTIETFDLPANDPVGGVHLTLQTSLTNPSSVGVELSTIGFANSFAGIVIGPAASTGAFSLLPKSTIQLPLAGRLIPQSTPEGLAAMSAIFNGFIHGVPSDLIVAGTNSGPPDCTWLNEGIKKLAIGVILPAAVNLQVINSITINQVTLAFTEATAYSPAFSTDNTVAKFQLPFAFPVDITAAQTSITSGNVNSVSRLSKRDQYDFATLNVPMLPSKTDIVERNLHLAFDRVPFNSIDNGIFSTFLQDTTLGVSKSFSLHGSANTLTSTAIGLLTLSDIPFNVETNLLGLQGLNAKPAVVSNLDVFHGYPSYLQINADAALFNPSNISISTGDVSFGLQFQGQIIGAAVITGLSLIPGDNLVPTAVHYQPTGGASSASGQILLENFVQGIVSDTIIVGSSSTTPIKSLQAALGSIKLATTIPPLHQNLITQANLNFPINIDATGVAEATFGLANPFTAGINLLSVIANASYAGIALGQIRVDNLNPPISAPGHTLITSPTLPFALVTDPRVLIQFIEAAATAQGVDLGILLPEFAYVLSLPPTALTASTIIASVNPNPETCAPTGTTARVDALILAAVKNLKTNLSIQSITKLDDYQTPLDFVQNNVPTVLGDSVLNLVGLIGKSIVANIVEGSTLQFSGGLVNNVTNNGFTVALKGSLLNVGPFDALIEFPSGVNVIWQGSEIATIALPPICSSGGTGVPNLATTGILTITNLARFTDFATYILLNPGFEWTITTPHLRVSALGTIFDNAVLTKNVSFSAFNGLPGVTIINPNFPSDVADGIALDTDSFIPSPSNLGIELGTATFIANFEGQEVGPISATGLTLAPLATTSAHLTGTIIKRTSAASTASLGVLFSQFLAGANQTLAVTGRDVVSPAQPGSPVNWLSAAFKKLTLNVVLPGHVYNIISSVKLEDLTVSILNQNQAYSVPTQNNRTDVVYKNPFGFSLTVEEAGGAFFISRNGVDAGVLTLPVAKAVSSETSTGQDAKLVLDFKSPQILQSLNTGAFNDFFNVITNTADVTFNLHGAANVSARTNAGTIPITGIPFDVTTDLLGLQSLNARPTVVSNLDVYHGYPTFLQINADATLFNPSMITLITNGISFGLQFNGQIIGTVEIGDLLLIPDANNLPTQVHYAPSGGASTAAGELLLANFVQGIVSNVSIAGLPNSSPYGSLQEALGTIQIQTSIPPLHQALITKASLVFPADVATTSIAEATFDLSNPLTAGINLEGLLVKATYQSFFLGQIDVPNLSPVISAAGHSNITSRQLPFMLTTDPKFLIQFIEAAATAQGVDLGILLPVFAFVLSEPSTNSTVTSMINPDRETCTPTGTTASVDASILAAVANLRTDLDIMSSLKLDDFQTNLNFVQKSVPTSLDKSVLNLVGLLGKTIVSNIVTGAALSFTGGTVTNVTDNGFSVALVGSLLNAGPFDALIEFPYGLDVIWQGSNIATISLPPICSPGGQGVPDYRTTGILQITDYARFTDFGSFILLNPSFEWTVQTSRLRVLALGTIFDNVVLSKMVTFDAFNKLAPGVTVSKPDFPGDASNGIKLTLDSLVPSPSNLGITLGDISFIASFEGQQVGPVFGNNVVLPPKSVTALPLTGTILKTDSPANLKALGDLFSSFLAGNASILQVTGNEVVSPAQPGSPVKWLSAAFKTLTLDVSLPGHVYDIVSAATLKDLDVSVLDQSQSEAALVTNNATEITFKNPFGFSLSLVQAGGIFILNYQGVDAGQLNIANSPVVSSQTSTGNNANAVIQFLTPTTFQALSVGQYNAFFRDLTTTNGNIGFNLHGQASIVASTAAGAIPIRGINFNVPSTFPGLQGLTGKASIPEIPRVVGGSSAYLPIQLTTILTDPAPLILRTNMASFAVFYEDTFVGRAFLDPLTLLPGTGGHATELRYAPTDPFGKASDILTAYVEQKGQIPITIHGDSTSSPYGALGEAFASVSLTASFPGQGIPLVSSIILYVDLVQAACTNSVEFTTQLVNNLECNIGVTALQGTASQNGMKYADFDHKSFATPFNTPPGGQPGPSSEKIVTTLSMGLFPSLALLSPAAQAQGLDLSITTAVNLGGFAVPLFKYAQTGVKYSVVYSAGGLSLSPSQLSNPLGALQSLVGALASGGSCINNGLGISIPALPSLPLTSLLGSLLPSSLPLTSLLGSLPTSLIPSIALPTNLPTSLPAPVSSVLAPIASVVASAVPVPSGIPIVSVLPKIIRRDAAQPTPLAVRSTFDSDSYQGLSRDALERILNENGFVIN